MTRRVVITGMGTINPVGADVPTTWQALCAGRSGIAPLTLLDTTHYKVKFGGEVKNFDPEKFLDSKTARRLDRFAQFALLAAKEAVKDSGVDFSKEEPYRCGVILGSGIGGMTEYEEQHTRLLQQGPARVSPFVIPKLIANSASGTISIEYGLAGPNTTVVTACASAAHAIADSIRSIQHGSTDIVISGGCEATITGMGLSGFINARALSNRNDAPQKASRPFDKDRDGFVLSEGAGILVLEEYEHARKRGAKIHAELLGFGSTADAHHITAPHPDGVGAAMAMKHALRDGKLNPADVQYINAHGTSTELGDAAETKAIKTVFGDHARKLAISSTKSITGHLLGASGGLELIAVVQTLRTATIHPTINYETPDPLCDLDYVPNTAREARVRCAISNSFGFGGHNCSLAVAAI